MLRCNPYLAPASAYSEQRAAPYLARRPRWQVKWVKLDESTLQRDPATSTSTVSPRPRDRSGKPRPCRVTSVPPATEPLLGDTESTTAYSWN
eukprot:1155707-Pelagomonas_calceolata.AAC.7